MSDIPRRSGLYLGKVNSPARLGYVGLLRCRVRLRLDVPLISSFLRGNQATKQPCVKVRLGSKHHN